MTITANVEAAQSPWRPLGELFVRRGLITQAELETALAAGVRSIIQPGGSKRDSEVIEAVRAAGAAMVFTGRRHFRH